MNTIENRLQQLRVRWKNEPQNRKAIEDEVRRVKIGLKLPVYIPPKEDQLVSDVKDALV